jgi:hypothetical protein
VAFNQQDKPDEFPCRKGLWDREDDPMRSSERKTGVKHAEVITARLVQDERGWLRLAS